MRPEDETKVWRGAPYFFSGCLLPWFLFFLLFETAERYLLLLLWLFLVAGAIGLRFSRSTPDNLKEIAKGVLWSCGIVFGILILLILWALLNTYA